MEETEDRVQPYSSQTVMTKTLDELDEMNRENFQAIMKTIRPKVFSDPEAAVHFVGEALDAICQKFGIMVLKKLRRAVDRAPTLRQKLRLLEKTSFYERQMNKELNMKGVVMIPQSYHQQERFLAAKREAELAQDGKQVERLERALRDLHNAEHDMRRSGLYFYYHNEVAYFISNPVIRTRMTPGGIVIAGQKNYEVYTNAPV